MEVETKEGKDLLEMLRQYEIQEEREEVYLINYGKFGVNWLNKPPPIGPDNPLMHICSWCRSEGEHKKGCKNLMLIKLRI